HAEGANGRQRAALRTAQRVLTVVVEHPLALVAARKLELVQEDIARVPAIALPGVPFARIFVALPRILSPAGVLAEHGPLLSSNPLPHVAWCDHFWRLDSNNRHHLHRLAVILVGPLLGPP